MRKIRKLKINSPESQLCRHESTYIVRNLYEKCAHKVWIYFCLINKTGFYLFYVGTDSFKMYLEHYLNINKVIVKANTLL